VNASTWIGYVPGTAAWRHRRKLARCRASAAHIQELVDRELSPTVLEHEVRAHVHDCPPCAAEETVYRELKVAIVRVSQRGDADLAARLRKVAIEMCHEQGEQHPT
jgi:hypothetical protein